MLIFYDKEIYIVLLQIKINNFHYEKESTIFLGIFFFLLKRD